MTQRQQLEKAIALVRGLVVTTTRRRPMNFSAWVADAVNAHLVEVQARLRAVAKVYEKNQGELKPEQAVSA